ncbi:hypothetical protein ACUY2J_09610 [Corynebacterium kroppenstedtii]
MSVTSARADDPGNYVSFGDSLAANPNMVQIIAGHNPALAGVFKTPPIPEGYCATGEDNFANRVAHDTGSSYTIMLVPAPQEFCHTHSIFSHK